MRNFELKKRELLDRVDILDVVSEHVTLKRSGRRLVGLCPFHTERTPSFTVTPERGFFKCFGCGQGGDVFSFVQLRENVSFIEAMHILADRAGIELNDSGASDSTGPGRTQLARVNAWASRFFRSQLLDESAGKSARAYVRDRGVSEETAERFSLGLATGGTHALRKAAADAGINTALLLAVDLIRSGDHGHFYDTFRDRLMFPIRDASSRVIGFGGRTLVDDRAKYLNSAQNALFNKGRSLYGIDLARDAIGRRRRAILVEGYTDCLACHQAGFAETVATLGTALTEIQVDLLRRYCDEIILLFDSDQAGEAAADRAIRVALPRCVTVRLARISDGKDPCEFLGRGGAGEFSDLLNDSLDALEFKWFQTLKRFKGDESDARRREAILEFLRVVTESADAKAVDAIQRGLLVNQVAHLLRMNRSDVDRLMVRLRPKRARTLSSGGGRVEQERPSAHPGAEQAAWTHLLEVLLNQPGLWAMCSPVPDVCRIVDERDRRIASAALERGVQAGELCLADVLAQFDEPADVTRVLELAERGAERGNYERTFSLALERIRGVLKNEEAEWSREKYFAAQAIEEPLENSRDQVAGFQDRVRERRSYVPRRMIRQAVAAENETTATDTMERQ